MSDCLFCKIAAGEIPSKEAYADDEVYGFHDISPQAPVHVLLIPRKHIASMNDASEADAALLGKVLLAGKKTAARLGIAEGGYRLVNNCGDDGGQTVHHLHVHLLGGRGLTWPPG